MSYHRDKRAKKVTVGTNVAFDLGGSTVVGVVIEDRGPLGPGGLRLFRVRAHLDDLIEPFEADVREDRLRRRVGDDDELPHRAGDPPSLPRPPR